MAGTPAPRSSRAGKVSANSLAPVALATRLAATSPGSRSATPPSNSTLGSPDRSAFAAATTASSGIAGRDVGGLGRAGSAPSSHETSAGRMSVATWPGGPTAAVTASTASVATSAGVDDERTQLDTLRATVSMSDARGASN